MTNKHSTKKALLASVFSLVICFTMLLGTTFAWFTDTVTSTGNIIKSGKLDVTMHWANGIEAVPAADSADWIDASTGAIFNYDNWEPGYVDVKHIQIANVGTLALKYQVAIVANGEVSKLADVIDVYFVDPATQVADRTALTDTYKIGTLSEVLAGVSGTAGAELLPKESDTITIALKMQEDADNEYQNLSIGTDFSVQVFATQLTYEKDSFDEQYDVEATYLNKDEDGAWLITNLDELFFFSQDVNSGNDYLGETVKLTADIDLAGYNWIPIGSGGVNGNWIGFNGAFDGQGHTISNMTVTKGGGWNGLFGLVGRGTSKFTESISNVNVKNVVIEGANRMSGAVVGQLYGNIENCHVENVTISAVPNATGEGYDNGDKIGGVIGWFGDNGNNHYIRNCSANGVTLKAYRDVGGITGYIGSTATVEDCAVDTVNITVDQLTNHYGIEKPNAGAIVGRIGKTPVTVQNNTEANVTIYAPALVSDADQLVDALANGEDVVLTADVVLTETATIAAGANVTINLNGYTVTAPENSICAIQNEGTLTIEGEGTIEGSYSALYSNGNLTVNGGTFIATAGFGLLVDNIYGTETSVAVINGGTFTGVGVYNPTDVTINGGIFNIGDDPDGAYDDVTLFVSPSFVGVPNTANVTLNGGTFNGDIYVYDDGITETVFVNNGATINGSVLDNN